MSEHHSPRASCMGWADQKCRIYLTKQMLLVLVEDLQCRRLKGMIKCLLFKFFVVNTFEKLDINNYFPKVSNSNPPPCSGRTDGLTDASRETR